MYVRASHNCVKKSILSLYLELNSIPAECVPPLVHRRGTSTVIPGQRPFPWIETPLDTDPPGQRPLEGDHWDPPRGRPPDTDPPERTWDQEARQEVTSDRGLPVDRMTDPRLRKYYLAPNFVCGRQ